MAAPECFDYHRAAREAGITDDQLRRIKRIFRSDYPTDDMLYELHVLRTCQAVRDGMTTIEAILRDSREGESAAA